MDGEKVDDDARSERTDVSASTFFGDSTYSASEPGEAAVAAEESAAAESEQMGNCQPQQRIHRRHGRLQRDTAPRQTPPVTRKSTALNEAAHIGNTGWLFGNWGKRPSNVQMREHLDNVLKKQPAMVIGLAECQQKSEDVLRAPPAAVAASAAADGHQPGFNCRQGYQYLTLRGNEECSVLVGVRQESGNTLELLDWERHWEGAYRRRSGAGNRRANAYSRSMVVKVVLDQSVGFLGKEHHVMVLHMRNHLANGRFGVQKLTQFWEWLWQKVRHFRVQVMMGDFNMCLFKVIPELRSRGAVIDLGAWYPWKSLEGEPMSDSCGIFFFDTPGVYTLKNGIQDLHARDRTGILARGFPKSSDHPQRPAVAESGEDYDRIEKDGGPGMPLLTYLPKAEMDLAKKLGPSLTPSDASAAVAASAESARKVAGLKVKEKRLQANIWKCDGEHYKGSHFPICVFTNNVGRRSPAKLEERGKKKGARQWQGSQWRTGQQGQQSRETSSQTEATWTQPSEARSAVADDSHDTCWQPDSSRWWQPNSSPRWQAHNSWRSHPPWQADGVRWW